MFKPDQNRLQPRERLEVALRRHGLSERAAGKPLGTNENQIVRWIDGRDQVPALILAQLEPPGSA